MAGLVFAIATYVLGTWTYSLESSEVDVNTLHISFWQNARSIFDVHPFTFIGWITGITILAVTLGYLFDREVYFRRFAEQKANIDGLTEIYNHRYFQEKLSVEIERANRYSRPLSLIMFDLDNFKSFNDQHGHQHGDQLLKAFADLCAKNIRSIDVLARYGGEEFVIVMPETDSKEALTAAERIRKGMELEVGQMFSKLQKVTVSAGVAALPEHANTRHGLILAADTALYYAKRQGKNSSYIYTEAYCKVYRTTPEKLKALLSDEDMGAIEALSAAVDAKDHYTCGHSSSVSQYALELASRINMPDNDRESLKIAALLHDIGKIGTPDAILQKPGRLDDKERDVVEHHPDVGSHILQRVQQLNSIVPGVRHHHERYDGKGYPNGLIGSAIPIFARIIALADAFDAMTSDRPYRTAMTPEEALEEIYRCAGSQFDPELVDLFAEMIRQKYNIGDAAA